MDVFLVILFVLMIIPMIIGIICLLAIMMPIVTRSIIDAVKLYDNFKKSRK